MPIYTSLLRQLDDRRQQLGISKAQLARRSSVSLPTVNRVLSANESNPQVDTLSALAVALGVEVRLARTAHMYESRSVSEFRESQAREKALSLTRLVQGTMALEAEAVEAEVLKEIQEQNVHALLAGPPQRLWGD